MAIDGDEVSRHRETRKEEEHDRPDLRSDQSPAQPGEKELQT